MYVLLLIALLSSLSVGSSDAAQERPAIAGERYLEDLHTRACLELDAANVMSHVTPDKRVCELANPRLTATIPLLEHGSPPAILGCGVTAERERIYTLIATEGAGAYRLQKPGGNSHGMFQMTVGTYHGMRKGYPAAQFPKKFFDCAQDHLCSAKFAIVYNDANTALLQHRMPLQWRDQMRTGTLAHARYLAASYTAGMIAYRLVMRFRGSPTWTKKLPKAQWRRYVRMLEVLMEAPRLQELNT